MKDTLDLVSSKVWAIEGIKPIVIDIPEAGFDYNLINKYPEGTSFLGRHHDDTYANYTIINGDFKKVNLT